jgi:hypothetical protein
MGDYTLSSTSTDREYLTRRELAAFLTDRGFPISKSTLDKLAMPSRDEGPPAAGFWANRALYDPGKALVWAKSRFRKNWRAGVNS